MEDQENPTIRQVASECGLTVYQTQRFIYLGALDKDTKGNVTRESVNRLKRCYQLPPKPYYPR